MADQDVEKAFLDQAYQQIQNKANPIMKAPYRLGFEIVHKNDANTRMVGIFVFRINKDLYYAPVFFINGNIKGTDLFYRHSTKTFVPLTNEWVDYLLNMNPSDEGYSVEPRMRMEATPSNMDLNRIINPPTTEAQMRKFASEAWVDIQELAKDLPKESLLKRFIVEDGGEDAIAKIATAVKADKKFAQALFYSCDEDAYMPDLPTEKVASVEAKEGLVVHFNVLENSNVKQASATDIRQGYIVEDTRKDASLEPVYEAAEHCLETVGEPGVYNVLLADGSMSECLVTKLDCCMLDRRRPHDGYPERYLDAGHNPKVKFPELFFVEKSTGNTIKSHREQPAFGKFIEPVDKSDLLKNTMEAKKAYRLYNRLTGALSDAIYILEVDKTPAGLTCYYYVTYNLDQDKNELFHNPDYDGPLDNDRVLGKDFSFVPVAFEIPKKDSESTWRPIEYGKDLCLGNRNALDEMIFSSGYKKASVRRLNEDFYLVKLDDHEAWSPELSKTAARLCLMAECGVRAEGADEILTKADEKGCYSVFTKAALHLRAQSYPEFYAQFNDAYNVQEEPQNLNTYALLAHSDIPRIERNRVGDAYRHQAMNQDNGGDHGGDRASRGQSDMSNPKSPIPEEVMQTADPIQLFELSQQRGVGNMFEHGVVGSLTKTYDSISLVDKYLPDLEQGLDRIGRILFLYYWKPEDFAAAYGSDDQVDLENKLLSNFKQLGDMVLELLLKSQRRQQGSSTMKV